MKKRQSLHKEADTTSDEPPRQLSKHEKRAMRRTLYFKMIDGELPLEKHFRARVIHSLNRDGLDIAPDGRPIKTAWWDYIESRKKNNRNSAEACGYLVRGTIASIRPAIT